MATTAKESEPPVIRSWYDFTIHPAKGIHRPVISVINRPPHSIAHEPDDLFADLGARGIDLEAHDVIYQDSSGIWDELPVGPHGSCGGFAPLGTRTEREALEKLRARNQEDWDARKAEAENAEPEQPLPEPLIAGIPARRPKP